MNSGQFIEKVKISDLGYAVGEQEILKGIDAGIAGECVTAIVGPSGAGKSTLLRAINRLIEPTAGEIYLTGEPTSKMDPLELRRRVGMVFQLPALFGDTVEEAVLYGPRLCGKEPDPGRLLEVVGLDGSLLERAPDSLSVGQQQRVSIARALALEPEILLMDEPTSALDEAARRQVEGLIRQLNERLQLTVALVSHDLSQVGRVADQILLVDGGRCTGEWDHKEFFSKDSGERARELLADGTRGSFPDELSEKL